MKLNVLIIIFVASLFFLIILYFIISPQEISQDSGPNKISFNDQELEESPPFDYESEPIDDYVFDSLDAPPLNNIYDSLNSTDSVKPLIDSKPEPNGELVTHLAYTFYYSESHEQPYWVKYTLTKSMLENSICKRKDNFRSDPQVSTFSASLKDYKGSGFDRGHLCPAKDMEYSKEAMSESFFMSNMSPQHPSFNRGRWKSLESKVRIWSLKHDSLIIYCGGILDSVNLKIGPNNVSVPEYYYKVIFSVKKNKAISFVMPNRKCNYDLANYAVSVDSVEKLIHFNLFDNFSVDRQNSFEGNIDVNFWF